MEGEKEKERERERKREGKEKKGGGGRERNCNSSLIPSLTMENAFGCLRAKVLPGFEVTPVVLTSLETQLMFTICGRH